MNEDTVAFSGSGGGGGDGCEMVLVFPPCLVRWVNHFGAFMLSLNVIGT